MQSRLEWLNRLPPGIAVCELLRCCGSRRWSDSMVARRPFANLDELLAAAAEVWAALGRDDWLEAFSHHPPIGSDDSQQDQFRSTRHWSSSEQSSVDSADASVRQRLRTANDRYYERFGYIFLICATGKSAAEMLLQAESRLLNEPDAEIGIAGEEQRRITRLRLGKLLSP